MYLICKLKISSINKAIQKSRRRNTRAIWVSLFGAYQSAIYSAWRQLVWIFWRQKIRKRENSKLRPSCFLPTNWAEWAEKGGKKRCCRLIAFLKPFVALSFLDFRHLQKCGISGSFYLLGLTCCKCRVTIPHSWLNCHFLAHGKVKRRLKELVDLCFTETLKSHQKFIKIAKMFILVLATNNVMFVTLSKLLWELFDFWLTKNHQKLLKKAKIKIVFCFSVDKTEALHKQSSLQISSIATGSSSAGHLKFTSLVTLLLVTLLLNRCFQWTKKLDTY